MVRLVKGAYWDTEIKRTQVDGLPDYPVFTRKVHTDVSYLACARAMLAAPDALYPQRSSVAVRVRRRREGCRPRAGRYRGIGGATMPSRSPPSTRWPAMPTTSSS